MAVEQKKVDLNQPVDGTKESKLEFTALTPELSEASLTLHGDYYRQMQSLFTKNILWHKTTISIIVLVLGCYNYYILSDYIEVSESIGEFIQITRSNKPLGISLLFNSMVFLGCLGVTGVGSLFVSDEFKIISDKLAKPAYQQYIYGFELTKFAKLNPESNNAKDKKMLANGANSQIVLYKEEPIATITLKPLVEKKDTNLVVKITGINSRKAYKPLNFEQLLLDWAMNRAKDMLLAHLKEKKLKHSEGCKTTVLIDNYSFNHEFAEFLIQNKFQKIDSSANYNPTGEKTAILDGIVNLLFKSTRDTYAIHVIDNKN